MYLKIYQYQIWEITHVGLEVAFSVVIETIIIWSLTNGSWFKILTFPAQEHSWGQPLVQHPSPWDRASLFNNFQIQIQCWDLRNLCNNYFITLYWSFSFSGIYNTMSVIHNYLHMDFLVTGLLLFTIS